jgi:hypothetical protein
MAPNRSGPAVPSKSFRAPVAFLCVKWLDLLAPISFQISHALNDQVIGRDSQTVDQTVFMMSSVTIGTGDYLNQLLFQ